MPHRSPGRLYRAAIRLEREKEAAVLGPETHGHWAHSTRRKTGAFYTPQRLVELIVALALTPDLAVLAKRAEAAWRSADASGFRATLAEAQAWRVYDPACGCGRFLLAAFRVLRDLHVRLAYRELALPDAHRRPGADARAEAWEIGTQRALACLQGTDSNPQAVAAACAVLTCASGLEFGESAPTTSVNISVADGMTAVPPADGHRRIIVGNPPWGAAGPTASVARRMGLSAANANTFTLFLLACLERLAPGDRLGFVLPRNFCKGNDYEPVRRRLLQTMALEWLIDAGRAFPGVLQETVVIIARRLGEGESFACVQVGCVDPEVAVELTRTRQIPQRIFVSTPGSVLALNASMQQHAVCAGMEERAAGSHLRQHVVWARGLEYGGNGALIRCSRCGAYASLPKKKQIKKKCGACGAVLSGTAADYALITPESDATHSIPVYAGRHVRRYALAPPYWLDPAVPGVKYKNPAIFAGEKILAPKIAPFLAAALDATDAWTTQGVYILRPLAQRSQLPGLFPEETTWDTLALLALLNSLPMAFYYQCRFNDNATLTTNVTLANLLSLPVPLLENDDIRALLREGALSLTQNKPGAMTVERTEQIETAIDDAVGELFRLSAADMKHMREWRASQTTY